MIRASVVLLLAWLASRLMKNRPAAQRHLLWVTALVSASLLPALTFIVPSWRPEIAGRIGAALPSLLKTSPLQQAQQAGGAIVHAVGIETATGLEILLAGIWIAGALASLAMLLPAARSIQKLTASSAPLAPVADEADGEWIQTATSLAQTLGIKRRVRLLHCSHGSLPLTWGVFRPKILLPRDASSWTAGRRHAVLAHELAHIRRADWLFQIFAEIAVSLFWFHPLFWIARNRLHLESERACDDAVLNLGVEGKEYAQHLLDIARSLKRKEPAWSLAMAGQIHLERRVIAVLNPTMNRRPIRWTSALAVVVPLLCAALPIAALSVTAGPARTTPDIVYTMPPLYSDEALRKHIEGIVKIEARVDNDGHPRDLRVVRGLGFGLDENALLAVRSWKFAPGESIAQVDVEFNLLNAAMNEIIANDMVTAVGPGVVPPRIVHRVEARHPGTSAASRPQESVLLDALIQDDGRPKVLRVVRSLSWDLDEAAIAALEQWRFSPAQMDGEPVKVRMNVEMRIHDH